MLPVVGHAETGMESGQGGEARTGGGGAVITLFDGNELVALRLALGMPVIADEPNGAVHRIGAAKREIDVVEIARRAVGKLGGQPDGRFAANVEIGGGIRQFPHLLCRRLDDAVMAVAGIDAP